jgi:hypothetical protein
MVRRPAGGCHHVRDRIDPNDLAFGSDQGSQAQGRLSAACSNIENYVSTANQAILGQGLGDRRKHPPDHFAMFFPEGCSGAPFLNHRLVGLHLRKYNGRAAEALSAHIFQACRCAAYVSGRRGGPGVFVGGK